MGVVSGLVMAYQFGEFQFVSFFNQPRRDSGPKAARAIPGEVLIWIKHC
jgi:hypothetical protein